MLRVVALAGVLGAASVALAHARGFHKSDRVLLTPDKVQVLVTLDVDSGRKAQLLRIGADRDRSGTVDAQEAQALKQKLVTLAVRPLKVTLGGVEVPLKPVEAKISLRDERRTGEAGLSLAVLLEAEPPGRVFAGMELVVADEAPDKSHVRVEAEEQAGGDAGANRGEADLRPGDRLTLRLQGAM